MALNSSRPSEWLAPESATKDQEFWRAWLRQAQPALGASCVMIVQPAAGDQLERVMMRVGDQSREIPAGMVGAVVSADEPLQAITHDLGGGTFAVRLPWDEAMESPVVAVGEVPASTWADGPAPDWYDRVLLWATAAGRRRRIRELVTTRERADELAGALELMVLVRAHRAFKAAALEVCNQLAARHGADRVSLGWWRDPYVRVEAVSQMNQIESRMSAVGEVEAAMEEAIEQDVSLVWPRPEIDGGESVEIELQHAALARSQGGGFYATVPMRSGDRIVGAVTWQRDSHAFSASEVEGFALGLDALAPVLETRERQSGWFGRRWKRGAEEAMRRHWNLQHPWPKLAAVTAALVIAAMLLIHVPYRVEAEFRVRPVKQVVFSAAFDGFVESVQVAPGDRVTHGQPLFALDETALRLEEAELLADLSRFAREREQAEAKRELAGMRVAEAQRDQVAARLQRLQRRIAQTVAIAPFAGVVLDDGNLAERLGAPVRQGDALLRFAQLDGLFFELEVPEGDAILMTAGGPVEIAFRSRPDQVVPATITRIEPEAAVGGKGAFFRVRAVPVDGAEDWWRPGMTGIGKLITEKRSLADIFTRRLRNWLHLQLWW